AVEQGRTDRQQHPQLSGPYAAAGGTGRAQPFERQDEQHCRDQVDQLDDPVGRSGGDHGFLVLLLLNIFNMRSVMMNPPTTLLVEATMAMVPSTVARPLLRSPARMMAPTTAMASR